MVVKNDPKTRKKLSEKNKDSLLKYFYFSQFMEHLTLRYPLIKGNNGSNGTCKIF